jgi:hypothetical protein
VAKAAAQVAVKAVVAAHRSTVRWIRAAAEEGEAATRLQKRASKLGIKYERKHFP